MLTYHFNENILEAETQAIVNTVNCEGIMGKGLALQFKNQFPEMARAYSDYCSWFKLQPGQMHIYRLAEGPTEWIINFPTKGAWMRPSEMGFIILGLASLARHVEAFEIESISIPPLGCGLGGLTWENVVPKLQGFADTVSPFRCHVHIYCPKEA